MRAILTRVTSASVTIDGEVVGSIGKGFLILLGIGPNDPCPCGSGKKYKKCCMQKDKTTDM